MHRQSWNYIKKLDIFRVKSKGFCGGITLELASFSGGFLRGFVVGEMRNDEQKPQDDGVLRSGSSQFFSVSSSSKFMKIVSSGASNVASTILKVGGYPLSPQSPKAMMMPALIR